MSLANSNPKGKQLNHLTDNWIADPKFVFRLSDDKNLAVAFEYLITFSGVKKNREMEKYKWKTPFRPKFSLTFNFY